MLMTHYREPIDFSVRKLEEAARPGCAGAAIRAPGRRQRPVARRRARLRGLADRLSSSAFSSTISNTAGAVNAMQALARRPPKPGDAAAADRADRRRGVSGHRPSKTPSSKSLEAEEAMISECRSNEPPRLHPREELGRGRPHPRRASGAGHPVEGRQGPRHRRAHHDLGGEAVRACIRGKSAGQRPPLSCRTSPPQGGRLARRRFALRQSVDVGEVSEAGEAADLPPCGGDVRQDRGGQRRAHPRDSSFGLADGHAFVPKPPAQERQVDAPRHDRRGTETVE